MPGVFHSQVHQLTSEESVGEPDWALHNSCPLLEPLLKSFCLLLDKHIVTMKKIRQRIKFYCWCSWDNSCAQSHHITTTIVFVVIVVVVIVVIIIVIVVVVVWRHWDGRNVSNWGNSAESSTKLRCPVHPTITHSSLTLSLSLSLSSCGDSDSV